MKTRCIAALTTLLMGLMMSWSAMASETRFEFQGETLAGKPALFSAGGEKPSLVIFWASWCAICMSEVADIKAEYTERAGQLNFVGVNLDRTVANGLAVQQQRELPYDSVKDGELIIADRYGVRGTPTLFVVAADGSLVFRTNRLHKALAYIDAHPL